MNSINDSAELKVLIPLRVFASIPLIFCLGWSCLAASLETSNSGNNLSLQVEDTSREFLLARPKSQNITPAHVYRRSLLVRSQINAIRQALGKPGSAPLPIKYSNVFPRDAFFQAIAFNEAASALDYEWTRTRAEPLIRPQKNIQPVDVFEEVFSGSVKLSRVEARLNINAQHKFPALDPSKTPSDVFSSVVAANRALNNLLTRQFSPSDVFEQVTVALSYANQLRQKISGKQVPQAPDFIANKSPADVFQKLLACFQIVERIASLLEIDILKVNAPSEVGIIKPGDVYSVALLLVAELRHLNFSLDGKVVPPIGYYPGKLTPSFVFQRAGLLEKQLLVLESVYARSDHR